MNIAYRERLFGEWCAVGSKCGRWVRYAKDVLHIADQMEKVHLIHSWHYDDEERRATYDGFRCHAAITYRDFCLWAEAEEVYITSDGEVGLDEAETVQRMRDEQKGFQLHGSGSEEYFITTLCQP